MFLITYTNNFIFVQDIKIDNKYIKIMKRSSEYIIAAKVAIFDDSRCSRHLEVTQNASKDPLPERPARTQVISEALRTASFVDKLMFLIPEPATDVDLLGIHRKTHLQNIAAYENKSKEMTAPIMIDYDPDVILTEGSDMAARLAAGSVRDAVQLVLGPGSIKRVFCNVRPPGHHAHNHFAAGFCIYNNIWFGVMEARKYMTENQKLRIAIIDWDAHHGDGTQDFVYRNLDLPTYFVSIHQKYSTQYPMTGKECKKQIKDIVVVCHNISPGGGDNEVKQYFDNTLIPDLLMWKPDLIMISCGFDAHELDDISQLMYTSELYGWMTKRLVGVANECCGGKIVSVLEGGYNLQALRESSVEHVLAMVDI
jgi:acetoin utilization deacetylase AcuC-like enzyme